jgi:MORN repeat
MRCCLFVNAYCSWTGVWKDGLRHGNGVLSYSNSTMQWLGVWHLGKQHGVQVYNYYTSSQTMYLTAQLCRDKLPAVLCSMCCCVILAAELDDAQR